MAVVIVIAKSRAGSPLPAVIHSRLSGDIRKTSVAIVVKQYSAVEICNVQVVVPVVAVIAYRHAESPAAGPRIQSRARGHIGERAVAVVVIEAGFKLRGIR